MPPIAMSILHIGMKGWQSNKREVNVESGKALLGCNTAWFHPVVFTDIRVTSPCSIDFMRGLVEWGDKVKYRVLFLPHPKEKSIIQQTDCVLITEIGWGCLEPRVRCMSLKVATAVVAVWGGLKYWACDGDKIKICPAAQTSLHPWRGVVPWPENLAWSARYLGVRSALVALWMLTQ